ncbi:MAG: exosortase H [Deltaproteobacteria bacterium]|nr:exosortase H [Deltaproteobacteria bacterium]
MGKETERKKESRMSIGRFIITYVILMAFCLLLIGLEPIKEVMDINGLYTTMIVYLSGLFLKPFGIVKGIHGSVISLTGISMDVRFGCNGLEAFMIYAVAVLSFPAAKVKKAVGIIGGFVLLQIINILRIAGLGLSGVYLKEYFHYLHIYVAQGFMIVVALVIFLLWLRYANEQ